MHNQEIGERDNGSLNWHGNWGCLNAYEAFLKSNDFVSLPFSKMKVIWSHSVLQNRT